MTPGDPRFAQVQALIDQGRYAQARAQLTPLLRRSPADADVNSTMCFICARLGERDQALYYAQKAHRAAPGDGNVLSNLGNALIDAGKMDEAVRVMAGAFERDPGHPGVSAVYTFALCRSNLFPEAVEACERALALQPNHPSVLGNKAHALQGMGRPEESLALWRRAVEILPESSILYSGAAAAANYAGVPPEELLAAHRAAGAIFGRHLGPPATSWDVRPDPDRQLRVGVVSPDFRDHATAAFIEPLLEHHDRGLLRVALYSSASALDAVTERLKRHAAAFHDVARITVPAAAELIRSDRTDVLIDLAGHTLGHRLGVFHLKPAPVQMTWIGYPATTGIESIDYRVVDSITDPPGFEAHGVERLLRLDPCFLVYRPRDAAPALAPPPFEGGEPFTFGSFGAMPKFADQTVRIWGAALRAAPGTRLLVKNHGLKSERARADLAARLAREGVGAERLVLEGPGRGTDEMLGAYSRVDLSLDTAPYTGTTTTCESMWMGVPMVTLLGSVSAARVSASLLRAVGLGDLVAPTEDEYARIAAALAADRDRLRRLRSDGPGGLRRAMARSPVCDGPAFSRRFEAALREAWRGWCAMRIGGEGHAASNV